MLNEFNASYRQIFTDGRPLPVDPQPSWNGYSTGKWVGDELVVETIGFRDDLWLDTQGTPLTSAAKVMEQRRQRALLGDAVQLLDLVDPVDPEHDHIRGPEDATVTVVEYGDFQCPYCGQAERAILAEREIDPDVRYVWRHLPLTDVHPQAQLAAEAAEAAAAQDAFWPMHDLLLSNQDKLTGHDLLRYAARLGLDERRFRADLMRHVYAGRVARDVKSADTSGVSGTPTFFVNGQRYTGRFSVEGLAEAGGRPGPGPKLGARTQDQADVRVRTRPAAGSSLSRLSAPAGGPAPPHPAGTNPARSPRTRRPRATRCCRSRAEQQPAQRLDERGERLVLGEPAAAPPASSRWGRSRCRGTAGGAGHRDVARASRRSWRPGRARRHSQVSAKATSSEQPGGGEPLERRGGRAGSRWRRRPTTTATAEQVWSSAAEDVAGEHGRRGRWPSCGTGR